MFNFQGSITLQQSVLIEIVTENYFFQIIAIIFLLYFFKCALMLVYLKYFMPCNIYNIMAN